MKHPAAQMQPQQSHIPARPPGTYQVGFSVGRTVKMVLGIHGLVIAHSWAQRKPEVRYKLLGIPS